MNQLGFGSWRLGVLVSHYKGGATVAAKEELTSCWIISHTFLVNEYYFPVTTNQSYQPSEHNNGWHPSSALSLAGSSTLARSLGRTRTPARREAQELGNCCGIGQGFNLDI